jgi:hypothetical protein
MSTSPAIMGFGVKNAGSVDSSGIIIIPFIASLSTNEKT